MRIGLRRLGRELRTQSSGNATLMVALGIPALIGSTGLAVDTAQWYLWKRELQYAVDQAALAGAFARDDAATASQYVARARQEYDANLGITRAIATPAQSLSAQLADYDDGTGNTDNSVLVTATASGKLPFSSFLTGNAVNVTARAQAAFGQGGAGYTACMIALDEHADKAVWFNGGPDVNAGCGTVALSDSSKAIEVSGGSGTLGLGWVVAAGSIDDYFDDLDGTEVVENAQDLFDPFSTLSAPDNSTPRTLNCNGSAATYTATYNVDVTVDENYYEGENKNQMSLVSSTLYSQNSYTTTGTVDASAQVGDSNTTTNNQEINSGSNGSGKNKTYYRTDHDTETVQTIVAIQSSGGSSGQLQPGTYSDFNVSGTCTMAPGIYVIDGAL
ncbi:MAG: pilus assembly protein [Novosphingobium sp.]|nr:pilus assembly protein [Novosphingobium sp.]